jgi:GDP-D-mannose 3', 5'-epimerase
VLGWEPSISLRQGLKPTYVWIEEELHRAGRVAEPKEKTPTAT